MDVIMNGQASGDVAQRLIDNNFDPAVMRPFVGNDGRSYITRNGVVVPVTNTPATLRKDEWIQLDTAVIKVAQARLKLVSDLRSRGLQYVIPNGMGKTVLQSQNQSDINGAVISMDGLAQGVNDAPVYDITNLPLPIISKDFFISARELATSRNSGSPLDTTMAELAGRKVAETVEQLALGSLATYTFGGGTIYGLTNWGGAITGLLTAPTGVGWTPATLVSEILTMRQQSIDNHYYGPWFLYNAPAWDVYLDDDYSAAKGDLTLRDRIKKIEGISGVSTLDYMSNYDLIMVQLTSDVIRIVVGMEVTTVQWDSMGGLKKHFKVMTIQVPQLRGDQTGATGLVYAQAS